MTPEQVRSLRESATNIIAYQHQLEGQRKKLYDELERVSTGARQAVMMAEEASQAGEADKTSRFNESAEILSQQIITIDTQIAAIDIELIEASQASEEAKSIASDSAIATIQMKAKGAELRADFERAKMAEASLEATGAPSFDEVKGKIGERVAHAEAMAELADVDGETALAGATAMVEQAAIEARAAARLAEIRSQMGISTDRVAAPPTAEDSPNSGEADTPPSNEPPGDQPPAG
jgi:phage shock protein A